MTTDTTLQAQDDAAEAVAVAPRVTLKYLEETIVVGTNWFTAADAAGALGQPTNRPMELLTICVLTLANGFTVTGTSACASPENFNSELGREISKRNAMEKVWELEGYLLRQRLAEGKVLAEAE